MIKKPINKQDKQSFWTTVPGILTGIAAIITAIGGLIAVLNSAGLFKAKTAPLPSVSPTPIITTTAPGQTSISNSPSSAAPTYTGCFQQYFQGIAQDRISSLESGTQAFQLIGADQTKDEPVGIIFTQNNQPVGGIRFLFLSNGQLFKVDTVVDANCQKTEDYSNETRGGDKNVLQNFDSLQMRLGNTTYELRLNYDGSISADFRILSP
jgi:hypothetical protein